MPAGMQVAKVQMLGEEGKAGPRSKEGVLYIHLLTKPLVHRPPRLVFRRDQR